MAIPLLDRRAGEAHTDNRPDASRGPRPESGAPPGPEYAATPGWDTEGERNDDLLGSGSSASLAPDPEAASAFQPMPPLSSEQESSLRDGIRRNGVAVPITVDQFGRILDGHNRFRIAAELGIECPRVVQVVADDDDALDRAVELNCARRHLTQEQVREVVAAEVDRRPDQSDRQIARRVGCSPTTVGTVRRRLSNLDSPDDWGNSPVDGDDAARRSAVELTSRLREAASDLLDSFQDLLIFGLTNGITPGELIGALTIRGRKFADSGQDAEMAAPLLLRMVIDPGIEFLLDADAIRPYTDQAGGPEFKPLTVDERASVLAGLAGAA